MGNNKKNIIWFENLSNNDVGLVGGKNASLGEMYTSLSGVGVRVPNGFAITAQAYFYFLKESNLDEKIKNILSDLDTKNIRNLQERGKKIRNLILKASFPKDLEEEIFKSYKKLSETYQEKEVDVAVRSSATAEDLPTASFAGQQETYLNIKGKKALLEATKKCIASLFTDRAISYRTDKGFDHFKIGLSVGVQKMVRSDLAGSGVMFTLDTESGFPDAIVINASWGLGEMVVQGKVIPDEFWVYKKTLEKGFKPIIKKELGSKDKKLIYSKKGTKEVPVKNEDRRKFVLSNEEVIQLAENGFAIEKHYSERNGHWTPMDIEWAKDGKDGQIYIVQARPETIHSQVKELSFTEYRIKETSKPILKGTAVGQQITSGKVHIINNVSKINEFKEGEILVTTVTDPDWEPIMKIAKAIITNEGGRTSHAAIVSRELGIPAIVGTKNATKILKNGQEITVDCSDASIGKIYDKKIEWEEEVHKIKNLPKTKTKIVMNIGDPNSVFKYWMLPVDGVGLAREEFIITSDIQIHPLALIHFDKISSKEEKKKIEELTYGYRNKTDYYVEKLAQGVARIAAAFYPKEIIVRFSDFKTNEYAQLIGGNYFEPKESNPMIGWRGASRYYDERFKEAFKLECQAMKIVREKYGLDNLAVMVPFCRTPEEGRKVKKIMEESGLFEENKEIKPLKTYVMCEIPSNILRADEFLEIFDGFSIGSNDLTQLTLGIDRDNADLKKISDERDEAVKKLISEVIKKANEKNKYVGICGQAPSDFPDFAAFLVKEGIKTISVNPDVVIKTIISISKVEKKYGI